MSRRFCILALFAFAAYAAEPDLSKEKLTGSQLRENCFRESGLNLDQLANKESEMHFKTSRPFLCFAACMYKAFGVMNEDATLNVEFIIEKIDKVSPAEQKEKLKQAIRHCATEKGADDCETYQKITKCISDYTGFDGELKIF